MQLAGTHPCQLRNTGIYSGSLAVTFIPKAGLSSHVKAKDFRRINFSSSFLLKTLRLIDWHIRSRIRRVHLSVAQHTYFKSRSVDTELHTIVLWLEEAIRLKEFAVGTFLDIEKAFNNVSRRQF